jgi:ribonuclease HII
LADSKLLTAAVRERLYDEVVSRALAWSVVVIEPGEVDGRGLHVCNLAGMRRAFASLAVRPQYVLTDGFHVDGVSAPGLAVWKGDQVAACVAAASIVAKVTRDRIMVDQHERWPQYGFDEHKGYATPEHAAALRSHGPCPIHRFSYANVAAAVDGLDPSCGGAAVGRHARGGTVAVAARSQLVLGETIGMEGGSS